MSNTRIPHSTGQSPYCWQVSATISPPSTPFSTSSTLLLHLDIDLSSSSSSSLRLFISSSLHLLSSRRLRLNKLHHVTRREKTQTPATSRSKKAPENIEADEDEEKRNLSLKDARERESAASSPPPCPPPRLSFLLFRACPAGCGLFQRTVATPARDLEHREAEGIRSLSRAVCHLRPDAQDYTQGKEEKKQKNTSPIPELPLVSGQLTFTTPSSKRRKVAAELRKAGGNKGLYFLKTSPPRKPKIGKRYGQSSSTSALSALPQRGFFTEPSSPSSPRLSPARSLQVDSSHGSANEQSSTEDWRSTTATSSPTVTDGESTQDTTCWPMSSSNNNNRAAGQSAAAASDPPKEDVSMVDSNSSGVGGSLDNGNSHTAPPAIKRPAAEMGCDEHDTVMQTDSPSLGSQEEAEKSSNKAAGSKKQTERLNRHQRDASVDMVGKETESEPSKGSRKHASETSSSGTDPTIYTPSSSSGQTHASHDDNPSIDEQVAQVMQLMQQSPTDKQKGYIVSATWLKRVLSRSSTHPRPDKADKLAAEGEIGPVDNSDLVLVTDPDTIFNDEAGEPFVPMRPGLQMGEDYEILPEEAWNLVMKWYGLSNQSPAIVRYAHNTNTEGDMEHIQYELNPPIFSILKLSPNPSEAEKSKPPVRFLASRHTPFQQWLKTAKTLASINMSTKTRVWRILEGLGSSANVTPAASRSASPAPGTTVSTKIPTSISLGLEAFVGLTEGSQRELVDVQDHTANTKYNGRASIHVIGLGSDNVIVLEEQVGGPAGGEWLSETTKSSTNLTVGAGTKANVQNRLKNKSSSGSGRTSPAPSIVTRGRRRKDGKARGVTGLSNLGNTCYMNSALQCVRSVEELSHYFLMGEYKKDLNPNNPLSHNGDVAKAYANLLHQIFDVQGSASFAPRNFKVTIGRYGPSFSGYGQQDSQEFLLFLLDGLQEDLNRIQKKPYIEKPDSTDEMVHDKVALQRFADRCWEIYKARNDSVITDLFSGMYKSTVVCPECDKVSIIFDPFNNLTLQIPIENSWSHKIMFFPLHKPPVNIDVDIDKNSGIKAVKQFIAKKMNVNADRLVMAEIYKHKFYKLFDHSQSIADHQISEGDTIAMYELESVPTSYNPEKPRRFRFSSEEPAVGFNSPKADRMLVPIYNRGRVRRGYGQLQRGLFGVPMYVVISREEAYDYDAVLRQILARVANLTTRDILREDDGLGVTRAQQQAGEDSDTVVMNEDDTQAYGQTIKASSVEGEDGLVDVSMRDADHDEATAARCNNNYNDNDNSDNKGADDEELAPVLRPGSFIPPMLRNLFDVRYIATNDSEPTGFSIINEAREYPLMLSRVPDGKSSSSSGSSSNNGGGGGASKMVFGRRADVESVASSDDELSGPAQPVNVMRTRAAVAADDEMSTNSSSAETKDDSGSETDSDRMAGATSLLRSGKARSSSSKQKAAKKPVQRRLPYVKPGDVIVLDWNEETYDGVFGDEDELYGDNDEGGDGGLRGRPTWTNVSDVVDPEVTSKRQLRSRKKRRGITLDECLDEFGREEILSENDAWYCPRCKEHRRASKKFELWKAPDILVMHLKRFSANRIFRDKIDAVVDFPLELDMSGRVQMVEEGESMVYDLIAVDNHYGGLGGGHYTAYARNFVDGLWYEFNDSHVTMKRDPSSVVTSAAYLLFYRRRSDVPLGGSFLARLTEQAHDRASDDSGSESGSGNGTSGTGGGSGGGGSGSGEGKRLGGLSRNGSSGALHGAAATRQSGDGGLPIDEEEEVDVEGSGEVGEAGPDDEDEEEEGDEGFSSVRFHAGSAMYAQQPSWSYDRLANHGYGEDEIPRVFPPPGSSYADDGEGDDVASTQAERGEGDLSELDRSFELDAEGDADADETGMVFSSVLDEEHAHGHGHGLGHGLGHGSSPAMPNDFDDCPAVVEVRVDEE
ncbi:ubiquitin C-terminal hydrolase, putative [Trichophyton verrucosum HKI 0517]|uniref:ubiquitinyl hydrolase 1 n=1 Tax=Trichophyton verrucosum (strain HKI 0517) TaxID=663202 RepID=D4DK29_TRIVH|nr:ubiquitin C-terminal hydrolase, putative [Trichophyton verrucosum HKI 0517]EFE37805.1 ubiquitin C-terminal hydrolase, putative [Trichophyton verrucosum HKI 0517]